MDHPRIPTDPNSMGGRFFCVHQEIEKEKIVKRTPPKASLLSGVLFIMHLTDELLKAQSQKYVLPQVFLQTQKHLFYFQLCR